MNDVYGINMVINCCIYVNKINKWQILAMLDLKDEKNIL